MTVRACRPNEQHDEPGDGRSQRSRRQVIVSHIDLVVAFERPIGFHFVDLVDYLESLLGRQVDVLTHAGIQNIRIAQVAQRTQQRSFYVSAIRR